MNVTGRPSQDPTSGTTLGREPTRRSFAAGMVGSGALWMVYGVFTMVRPWGDDVLYSDAIGYSVVRDARLFVVYSLPGSLALILSAAGTIEMSRYIGERPSAAGTLARRLALSAAGLGVISLVGVATLFDPVFTAGRILGTLVLAAAVLVTAWAARHGSAAKRWFVALSVVGLLGAFLLPLWPLVNALQWIPQAVGACVIGLFGLGWVWLGWRLWRDPLSSRHH
jgi:hypothetical protein